VKNKRDDRQSVAGLLRAAAGLIAVAAIVVASSVGTTSAAAGAADDAFLQRLAGSWKGKGQMRPNSTAKVEPVSCRMSATWNGGAKSLRLSMNCRGIDVNFSSTSVLRTVQASNAIHGSWSGALGIGGTSVSGRRSGNSLALSMTTKDKDTGRTIRSKVYLQLSGNGRLLSNSVSSQDGKTGATFRLLSLSMQK
jgi:hypothetical protein